MTAQEQDAMLEEMALRIKRLLDQKECIRKADNVQPNWMAKEDICEYLEISPSMFTAAIDRAGELGLPLCYDFMTGYYVGFPGEQAKIGMAKYRAGVGLINSSRKDFVNLIQSGSKEDARQYLLLGGFDGEKFFKAFRGVNKPLPVQVEKALEDVRQLPA